MQQAAHEVVVLRFDHGHGDIRPSNKLNGLLLLVLSYSMAGSSNILLLQSEELFLVPRVSRVSTHYF